MYTKALETFCRCAILCRIKTGKYAAVLMAALILFAASGAYAGDALESYGDIGQIAIPVAALAMTVAYDNREGTIQFAKAFIAVEAVTQALKYSINSRRPNGGSHSFPSGHTAAAFAGASFIQQRYGLEYGAPAYIAATLVGVSRITSDNHHLQDVVAAAAIGIGANLIFTKRFGNNNIAVTPVSLDKGAGLLISYNW